MERIWVEYNFVWGHDIVKILNTKVQKKNVPTAIIAKTVKGKGISFMENNNDWHHGRLTKKLTKKLPKELKIMFILKKTKFAVV